MQPTVLNHRFALLACGMVMGLGISFYWPHEPLKADASSLDKFSLCTAPTLINQNDAVFVLDSVTARLVGAAPHAQNGSFSQVWTRDLTKDFGVIENAKYLMVSGFMRTQGAVGGTPAQSGVYVAELTSGKVVLYGFMLNNRNQAAVNEMSFVASFPFRDGM